MAVQGPEDQGAALLGRDPVFQNDGRPIVQLRLIVRQGMDYGVKGRQYWCSGREEHIDPEVDGSPLRRVAVWGSECIGSVPPPTQEGPARIINRFLICFCIILSRF